MVQKSVLQKYFRQDGASTPEKFGAAPQFLADKSLSPRWLPGQPAWTPLKLSPPAALSLGSSWRCWKSGAWRCLRDPKTLKSLSVRTAFRRDSLDSNPFVAQRPMTDINRKHRSSSHYDLHAGRTTAKTMDPLATVYSSEAAKSGECDPHRTNIGPS